MTTETAAADAPVASTATPATAAINRNVNSDAGNPKQQETNTRLSNTTACLPVVYGSIAYYLGKKADEYQTHEWTLFVRGPNQEDLSAVVSKVVFQLHASFPQPIRELTQPPFEVTERGWGEFEAQIRIHWKDNTENPIIVNHLIKLYPHGSPPNQLPSSDDVDPVVAETYDEVVFTDPNETFYRQLQQLSVVPKSQVTPQQHLTKIFSDQEDFLALVEAQKFLQVEISKVKSRYEVVANDLQSVEQALLVAQQQHQQREAAAAAAAAASSSKKSKAAAARKRAAAAAAAAATATKRTKTS